MKKEISILALVFACLQFAACNNNSAEQSSASAASTTSQEAKGQSGVQDDVSAKNVVQIASGSKDHTTLVKAVVAAKLVDVLSNTGPFTVFAPTNAAFAKLPTGTVEGLLKADKIETLTDILQYHVFVGVLKPEAFVDGQTFNQVNGDNITITKKDGKTIVNGAATIVSSIPASNGIIHVIDGVLLPPAKK